MMVLALAVVLIPLFAAAALAQGQLIQCTTVPCYGGKGDDQILQRVSLNMTHTHDALLRSR